MSVRYAMAGVNKCAATLRDLFAVLVRWDMNSELMAERVLVRNHHCYFILFMLLF